MDTFDLRKFLKENKLKEERYDKGKLLKESSYDNLRKELRSINRSLGFIDRQRLSAREYQEVEKQIAKNKIKKEAFEKKFGIPTNKIFPNIYGDSTKTPKYTDKLLNEMIEFLNS